MSDPSNKTEYDHVEVTRLAQNICVCTSNHDPVRRIECAYALAAAEKVAAAGWQPPSTDADYRLRLLRAVVSFVDTNGADLPLTLLDSIRAEIGGPR